jgi:hypothetical protein
VVRRSWKRIIVATVILFAFFDQDPATAQCLETFSASGFEEIRGIDGRPESYYRNLIIQDIGLANQQLFEEVNIRFGFSFRYRVDQCQDGALKIQVMPFRINADPLFYRGFDISGPVEPEKADATFYIFNKLGIMTDSLLIRDIPVEKDSSLYSLRLIPRDRFDGHDSVVFARASFHYEQATYEHFRDRIMEIDRYHAATELADSAYHWANGGFLRETDSLPWLFLRKYEMERILRHVDPASTASFIAPGQLGGTKLSELYSALLVIEARYNSLVMYGAVKGRGVLSITEAGRIIDFYFDLLDHYNSMTFTGDFRNMSFLEPMASPLISNSLLNHNGRELMRVFHINNGQLRKFAYLLVGDEVRRGEECLLRGDQARALKYYRSAYNIAVISGDSGQDSIFGNICRIRKDIVTSWLEISRKSCLAGNPQMAARYYRNAVDQIGNDRFSECSNHVAGAYEEWMYATFLANAMELINKGENRKALEYLEEIQSHCSSSLNVPCPPELTGLFKSAMTGIYLEYLTEAVRLFDQGLMSQSNLILEKASDIRTNSGYAIPADPREMKMDGIFRQARYNECINKGVQNLGWQQPEKALYYFNKAYVLETSYNLAIPDIQLPKYRLAAARQVIQQKMSDTRARAIISDFEGYQVLLTEVSAMIASYGFSQGDSLLASYLELQQVASVSVCRQVNSDFNEMMAEVLRMKTDGNFNGAYDKASQAVQYSLDHLECMIDDSRAWYEKVVLEPLAEFQEKGMALQVYEGVSPQAYMKAYREYSQVYYSRKLIDAGLELPSLYSKVLESDNIGFLQRFLRLYIDQHNLNQALDVLRKLKEMGVDASSVAGEQKDLAQHLAERDAITLKTDEPWVILDGYAGADKWYWNFRWKYKFTWIGKTGGKIKYWPILWKK